MIQKIKNWFTMIEMLVVITIIWILIATLAPQVWNSQEKSRDITQQTHIQELASALISYKLDYWKFPIITWEIFQWNDSKFSTNNSEWYSQTPTNWWCINKLNILKENKYISTIHKNPNNRNFSITSNKWKIYEDNYSIYMSDWNSFAIISDMENEAEWNCNVTTNDLFDRLTDNGDETQNDIYEKISNLSECINTNNWTGLYYVYVYANTIE